MNADFVSAFYADDHVRLDALLSQYRQLKGLDRAAALEILQRFKEGLEQHMVWEEAILFSEYDERVPSPEDESPTIDLAVEHQEIRDGLETILRKLRAGEEDTSDDEARMTAILAAHNESEERGLYRELDAILNAAEKTDLQKRMEGLEMRP